MTRIYFSGEGELGGDPGQLAWLEEMERIEQEVFPDARPRGEVVIPCTCRITEPWRPDPHCPIHGSSA